MRSICRNVCPCLWYKIRFIHIFVVCCFNFMIKPDSSVAYGILFILILCSDKVTFYWAIKGITQRGRRHKCPSLENARNKPFSDSRYWTGTSLQLRLWYENDIPRKSLNCKLVPVPCRVYEYGLFTYRVVNAAILNVLNAFSRVRRQYQKNLSPWKFSYYGKSW